MGSTYYMDAESEGPAEISLIRDDEDTLHASLRSSFLVFFSIGFRMIDEKEGFLCGRISLVYHHL